MANILCIETSGEVCSVALFDNETCLDFMSEEESFQHAAVLTVLIEKCFKNNKIDVNQLDAIAVSAGPGSYTGLRIGTSVAKGLCYAGDLPMLAISSLEIMANGLKSLYEIPENTVICPLIDARRMEVYAAAFHPDLSIISEPKPLIVEETSFDELLENPVYFVGNGTGKTSEVIKHDNARFFDDHVRSALFMGMPALKQFQHGQFADLAYFEPFYLKEFYTSAPKKAK